MEYLRQFKTKILTISCRMDKNSILQDRINSAQKLIKLIPKVPAPVKIYIKPVVNVPTIINTKPKEPELR